jgi:BirA family biotin operon repressor/biotin-[acetyl-CoA-carboxylase] ligase
VPNAPFFSRQQRFAAVGSTNDVVRDWLAEGVPEVALAVADEQTAGRGREGRTWTAPRGTALLVSAGFRPIWIPAEEAWRIPATVSLAMADAAEEAAGLADRAIRLKWPNDLVTEDEDGAPRKLAGVLGESEGLGSGDPRVVVGIGVNADWAAIDFPPELADSMTSLRVASGGRPVDAMGLLDAFMPRLESRIEALRVGFFDIADFAARQLTDQRIVRLELPDGATEEVRALAVDPQTGALVVADPDAPGGERQVFSGEIRHVRLADGPVRSASGV